MKNTYRPLLCVGCVHLGFKYADIAYTKAALCWCAEADGLVMVMSDLIENSVPHKGGSFLFDQTMTPQEQLEAGVELLKPHKNRIVAYCSGNHSHRSWEAAGLEVDKIIAQQLGLTKVFKPEGGLMSLKVGSMTYKVAYAHGVECGSDTFRNARKLNALYPSADICVASHTHVNATTKVAFFDVARDGARTVHETAYVSTGSNLNYPRYGAKAMYRPQPKGYAVLWLGTKERSVKVDVSGVIPGGSR